MLPPLQTSEYDRVLVIDTQVVLETKPMDQLPWDELATGAILLLVCRQVQSEIDAKKNDGRLGERSRSFNRLLDTFLETRVPATLRRETPRVDIALMRHASIDWSALDDLDRDEGDDRIVAQALNAAVDDPSRLELFSHDMRPRDAAITHGLSAAKLPEHWLREKAQTAEQREISRLQRELRTATTDQPKLEITLETLGDLPWSRSTVSTATEEERSKIATVILDANLRPKPQTGFSLVDPYGDFSLPERWDEWKARLLSSDLPAMHVGLSRLTSQHRLRVTVRNVGAIPAEGLSLEVRSGNVVLHARPFTVRVFGDPAPEPETQLDRLSHLNLGDLRSPRRDEPFTVYEEITEPGSVLSWSCRSFRQERSLTLDVFVELEERTGSKAHIEAVVTAANLRGDVRDRAIVDVDQRTLRFSDFYDVESGRLRRALGFSPRRDGHTVEISVFRNDGELVI